MKKRKKSKIGSMYRRYGEHSEGICCGGCHNCKKTVKGGKKIYKCLAYGVSDDPSTDWNPMYNACGYFNMPLQDE